jgi:monovalent cation/proton antiporter MnhG/PhaG subunit
VSGALELAAAAVLALGLLATLAGAFGVLLLRDAFAALHCASLVGLAGPVAVVAGALAAFADDPAAIVRLVLFLLVAIACAGAATHAIARALHVRRGTGEPGAAVEDQP